MKNYSYLSDIELSKQLAESSKLTDLLAFSNNKLSFQCHMKACFLRAEQIKRENNGTYTTQKETNSRS